MPLRPVIFPVLGLHENAGYDLQPAATSSDLLNVRAHDSLKGRGRGGRRGGLSKWLGQQINGDADIQRMLKVVEAIDYQDASDIVEQFIMAGVSNNQKSPILLGSDGTSVLVPAASLFGTDGDYDGSFFYRVGNSTTISGVDGGANNQVFRFTTASSAGTDWFWDVGPTAGGGTSHSQARVNTCAYDETTHRLYVGGVRSSDFDGNSGASASLWALDADDGSVVWSADLGGEVYKLELVRIDETDAIKIFCVTEANSSWEGNDGTVKNLFKINRNTGEILNTFRTGDSSDDAQDLNVREGDGRVLVVGATSNTWEGFDGNSYNVFVLTKDFNFVAGYDKANGASGRVRCTWPDRVSNDYVVYSTISGQRWIRRFTDAGTQVWTFDPGDNFGDLCVGQLGNLAVVASENNGWTGAAGNTRNFWLLDAATGTVVFSANNADVPTFSVAGTHQVGRLRPYGTVDGILETVNTPLLAVAGGTMKKIEGETVSTPTDGSSAFTSAPGRLFMVQLFQKVFAVDGVNSKYFDIADDTVYDWATEVTNNGEGTLPANARLIARFRGRIVLAGLQADPNNWFMSRVGDPFDWDYAPATTDSTQAVAGNASETGLIGDVITALIPRLDDALIVGCQGSIWQISGDPAAGGSIDLVSSDTGIAWGDAWAYDPNGILYFMGTDGIYRMAPNSPPENITNGKIEERIKEINLSSQRVQLQWDFKQKGLWVAVTGLDDQPTTMYFYDGRSDGWFIDDYPLTFGPSSIYAFNGAAAEDNVMLLGCRDGYIRVYDPLAETDDENDITSRVRFAPIAIGDGVNDGVVIGLTGLFAEDGGEVVASVYVGQTAEQCALSETPRFTRTLTAGRNTITIQRARGAFVQLELSQTGGSRWAMESIKINIKPVGRSRRLRRQ